MTEGPHTPAQAKKPCGESVMIADRVANIMTWLREPDWIETASLEWLKDWMNRRPIAELAMVAMLMPSEGQGKPDCGAWRPAEPCKCSIMCQDLGEEGGCRYKQPARETLRKLVDIVYQHATESAAVPATHTADLLIDRAFGVGSSVTSTVLQTPEAE